MAYNRFFSYEAKSDKCENSGQPEENFSVFRESLLKKGQKDLELLQLTEEQTEAFIRSLYHLSDHFISQSLEKNII